jgi:hypothetical protein
MKKYIILFILLFGAGIAISDIDTFEGTATDSLSDIEGSTVAGGGVVGPDQWYYAGGDSDFPTSTSVGVAGRELGNTVTIGQGGTVTKIGVRVSGTGISITIKALDGTTQKDCASIGPISPSNEWIDVDVNFAVSTDDVITVAVCNDSAFTLYRRTTGTGHYTTGITYATYCSEPHTWSDDPNYFYAVRVYVD